MKKLFKIWLIENTDLKEFSKNGSRSTIPDYCFRISSVAKNEKIDIETLALNIISIIPKYETGEHRYFGEQGHESVLNALRYFKKFVNPKVRKSIFKLF